MIFNKYYAQKREFICNYLESDKRRVPVAKTIIDVKPSHVALGTKIPPRTDGILMS